MLLFTSINYRRDELIEGRTDSAKIVILIVTKSFLRRFIEKVEVNVKKIVATLTSDNILFKLSQNNRHPRKTPRMEYKVCT